MDLVRYDFTIIGAYYIIAFDHPKVIWFIRPLSAINKTSARDVDDFMDVEKEALARHYAILRLPIEFCRVAKFMQIFRLN
jgi:hypothetical protein